MRISTPARPRSNRNAAAALVLVLFLGAIWVLLTPAAALARVSCKGATTVANGTTSHTVSVSISGKGAIALQRGSTSGVVKGMSILNPGSGVPEDGWTSNGVVLSLSGKTGTGSATISDTTGSSCTWNITINAPAPTTTTTKAPAPTTTRPPVTTTRAPVTTTTAAPTTTTVAPTTTAPPTTTLLAPTTTAPPTTTTVAPTTTTTVAPTTTLLAIPVVETPTPTGDGFLEENMWFVIVAAGAVALGITAIVVARSAAYRAAVPARRTGAPSQPHRSFGQWFAATSLGMWLAQPRHRGVKRPPVKRPPPPGKSGPTTPPKTAPPPSSVEGARPKAASKVKGGKAAVGGSSLMERIRYSSIAESFRARASAKKVRSNIDHRRSKADKPPKLKRK